MRGLQAGAATLTVLFTDLVSSTELRSRLGDERADRLRREHDDIVATAVGRNGGTVVKGLGDGMMAAFAAPSGAIAAAVAIQQAIDARNRSAPVPLALRVGVSAGEVRVEEADVFGTAVVEASRLCAAAEAHQVLMSDLVRQLAGSRSMAATRPVGSLTLKGLGEPLPTVEVQWWAGAGSSQRPPFPDIPTFDRSDPLVGRRLEEVAATQALLSALGGRTGVLVVSGAGGTGKTRFVGELLRRADNDGVLALYGRSSGIAAPHQPLVDALRPIVATQSPSVVAERLGAAAGALARLFPELGGHLPSPPAPLRESESIDGRESAEPSIDDRSELAIAAAELLRGLAAANGAVLVLDDLHLAAHETTNLVQRVVELLPEARLLVVVVAQHDTPLSAASVPTVGSEHPLARLAAAARAARCSVEELHLGPLDPAGVDALLGEHGIDDGGDPRQVAAAVHDAAGGNPLLVVELLQLLRSRGVLVADTSATAEVVTAWRLVLPVEPAEMPRGAEVLRQRLANLDPGARAVLRAAAAAGLEIDLDLLAHATVADTGTVLGVLERTDATRLTIRSSIGNRRRSFAHDSLRWLLDREAGTETVGVHTRLAAAWEERLALGDDAAIVHLAHHRSNAGAVDSTTCRLLMDAARYCEAHLAPGVASHWWGLAAQLAGWLDGRDGIPAAAELEARRAHCARAASE